MKKVVLLVIVFSLIMAVVPAMCMAENTSEQFSVLDFGYYNGSEPATSLNAGDEIQTEITIVKKGNIISKATLITCLLSDGEIISINSSTENFTEAPLERTITAKIIIPADATGNLNIQSYLWGGWDEMHPLSGWSDFYSENAEISNLYINGKLFEEFSSEQNEFQITLPASTKSKPKIYAECEDLGTKVTTQYEDEKVIITATPRTGESKVYTINYTIEEPVVTAKLIYDYITPSVSEVKTDDIQIGQRLLVPPEYQYDESGNLKGFGEGYPARTTMVYKDNYQQYYFVKIPDELVGATVLQLPGRMRNSENASVNSDGKAHVNKPYDFSDMKVEITLNRSATFYFPATAAIAALSGATESTVSAGLTVTSGVNGNTIMNTPPTDLNGTSIQGKCAQPGNQGDKRYEVYLEVPEGEDEKTFEIPVVGTAFGDTADNAKAQWAPILFLKFDE